MSDHKLLVTPWSNTACTFQTLNTENKLGNSRYTITKNQVQRYAPGNQAPDRDSSQVNNKGTRQMLYVSGADLNALTDALNKQQTLYIVSYGSFSGTQIGVSKAQGSTAALIVERCSLRPQDGYHPFDFVMDDPGPGKVIGAHLGHAIIGNTIKY